MSSAICFNLDRCKILLSGNGLREKDNPFKEEKVYTAGKEASFIT